MALTQVFVDAYQVSLPLGITASQTTLSLPTGIAAVLNPKLAAVGSSAFWAVTLSGGGVVEQVYVTGATVGSPYDTLTMTRGQDGTSAQTWGATTTLVTGGYTAGTATRIQTAVNSATAAGVTAVTTSGSGIAATTISGVVTLQNTGVTSLVPGTNITLSSGTGAITISAAGGGSGTVNAGAAGQLATYSTTGTAVSGVSPSGLTVGTASNLAGGVANQLPIQTAAGTTGFATLGSGLSYSAGTLTATGGSGSGTVNSGTGGQIGYYSATGTAIGGVNPSALAVGSATNLIGGAANQIAYQSAANTTGFLTLGTGLSLAGTTLNATGGSGSGTVNSGGAGTLAYYSAAGTAVSPLTLGTNLSITGSTLNATGTGGGVTSLTAGNGITLSGSTGAVTVSLNGAIVTAQALTFSGTTNTTAQGITLASGVAPSNGYFTYVVSNATYTAAQAQQLVPTTGTAGVAGDIFQWTGTAFIQLPQNVVTGAANQLGYYAAAGQILSPLTLGTNLSITGSTLNATGGGGGGTGAYQNLVSSGDGIAMLPSGTVSTAGAFTPATTIGVGTYTGYAYFPSGAVTAGAGLYWVVLAAGTTGGNVYQPAFAASGFPVRPTTLTLVTGTNTAFAQTTASPVLLFSVPIYPTVTLGVNGRLMLESSCTVSTGVGNNFAGFALTTSAATVPAVQFVPGSSSKYTCEIFNDNSASSQVNIVTIGAGAAALFSPTAINTGAACYFNFSGQITNVADVMILQMFKMTAVVGV